MHHPRPAHSLTLAAQKSLGIFVGSSNGRLRDVEECLEGAATKEELALKADKRFTEVSAVGACGARLMLLAGRRRRWC